jgi:hypothetical protein
MNFHRALASAFNQRQRKRVAIECLKIAKELDPHDQRTRDSLNRPALTHV